MRGDERRVVEAFTAWLRADGWSVRTEVEHCDVVAERDGQRLYCEAKGRVHRDSVSTDTDTAYGQLLRRMPPVGDNDTRFGLVVPEGAVRSAQRVPARVRALLRIDVYSVADDGTVTVVDSCA